MSIVRIQILKMHTSIHKKRKYLWTSKAFYPQRLHNAVFFLHNMDFDIEHVGNFVDILEGISS